MLDRILFNPDNRLLGSSTSDLSQYGGQTDPSIVIREARDGESSPLAVENEARTPAQSPVTGAMAHDAPTALDGMGAVNPDGGAGSPAFQLGAPLIAAPVSPAAEAAQGNVTLMPAAPQGFAPGAGTPIPHLDPSASQPASAEPTGSQADPQATLHDSPLADTLSDSAVSHVLNALAADPLGDTLAGVTGAVAPLVEGVGAPVAETLGGVADAVSPLVESTTGAVASITDSALDGLTATVSPVAEAVTDGLGDSLDGLAGTDPDAGVATLVNLVSVSEMFDLHPVDAPVVDAGGDPGIGIVDALVGEDLLDPLLGGHDASSGLLDHAPDTHHPLGL